MKQAFSTNENKGFLKIASRRGTPGARAKQMLNNKAAKNDLLAIAQKSIQASRSAIGKLIDATPLDDHYTLERLGPILAELRAAESILNAIAPLTTPSKDIGHNRHRVGADDFSTGEGSIMTKQKWDIWTLDGERARVIRRSVSERQWLAMQEDRTLWRVPAGFTRELVSHVGEEDGNGRPKLTKEQFWEEMEAITREIEIRKAAWAAELGLTPQDKNNHPLEDQQDLPPPERWNVWVIDYVEMTCEIALSAVAIEDANDFKAVWKDTISQVVIVPTDFEIVNREEQARKLGEVASQLLDLSFGNVEDNEESASIHTAFHEAVSNGLPAHDRNMTVK